MQRLKDKVVLVTGAAGAIGSAIAAAVAAQGAVAVTTDLARPRATSPTRSMSPPKPTGRG